MRQLALFLIFTAAALAEGNTHSTGNRITPPTVRAVAPVGVARGTSIEMTVEGFNLAHANAVYFSQPGISAKIVGIKELPDLPDVRLGSNGGISTVDLGPLPPRNEVRLSVEVSPDAPVGPVSFRVLTPLGTSPEARFLIEPYYGEATDREPNDLPDQATEVFLPAILTGSIAKQGDMDFYKIKVQTGEQLVFENGAMAIGSSLQPVISILKEDQSVLGEWGREGMDTVANFAYTFQNAGTYYVKIEDFAKMGAAGNFYRIKMGNYSLAKLAYPLGFRKGTPAQVQLVGYNIKPGPMAVESEKTPSVRLASEDMLLFRPKGSKGQSFSEVRLGIGDDPEVMNRGLNVSTATAQAATIPSTINGKLESAKDKAVSHYYKFHAKKGQELVFEVAARRLGSDLDSCLQILDAQGKPVERATIRPVMETFATLRDHPSTSPGIRLASDAGLAVGDYLMLGNEIVRISALPRGPDDDTAMESFGSQRVGFFGTTPEAHPIDRPVYKIQIHPPKRQFSPNGLPLIHLNYENDDGGPGYDKDSYVHFKAPEQGDYYVRIHDVRGWSGPQFAYRLNVRPTRPDFRLAVSPENPNVPLGGSIPVTVTARRIDGFDGPINVELLDLPAGFQAMKGVIPPEQASVSILISAAPNAQLANAVPLKVSGRAQAGNREIAHIANPEDKLALLALMPQPDIKMHAITKVVELEPGQSADVQVQLERQNGFAGRVPVSLLNVPRLVRIANFGLNGVLIAETENTRSFKLEALPSAQPMEQVLYVVGEVETRSKLQNSYGAAEPILLRIKPKNQVAQR